MVVSGQSAGGFRAAADLPAGVVLLEKPFTLPELREAVRSAVAGTRPT